jgi:hypothetical protein
LVYLHHQIRRQIGPKPVKFQKIRYKSVITQKKLHKIKAVFFQNKFPAMCCGQFALMAAKNTCILPV